MKSILCLKEIDHRLKINKICRELDVDRCYREEIKEVRDIGNGISNMAAKKCFTEQSIYTSIDRHKSSHVHLQQKKKKFCRGNKCESFEGRLCMECEKKSNMANITGMAQSAKMT